MTARRHSGRNVTTAAVRDLEFRAAVHVNNTLVITGEELAGLTVRVNACWVDPAELAAVIVSG